MPLMQLLSVFWFGASHVKVTEAVAGALTVTVVEALAIPPAPVQVSE